MAATPQRQADPDECRLSLSLACAPAPYSDFRELGGFRCRERGSSDADCCQRQGGKLTSGVPGSLVGVVD